MCWVTAPFGNAVIVSKDIAIDVIGCEKRLDFEGALLSALILESVFVG